MVRSDVNATTEWERLRYIQIEADLWAVMREAPDRPRAIIERVHWRDGSEQYLLKTWHTHPSERKLVSIHESLEDACRAVRWNNPKSTSRSGPGFRGHPGTLKN